jgi:hypothetical protein
MIASSVTERTASLMVVEGGLTTIAIAVAFYSPTLGAKYFSHIERAFKSLARRQGLAVLVVGLTAILSRLAVLPLMSIPNPFGTDDFSFLLAANTFASGRLTNPTPPMWVHFESIHISMKPTYMSMYFPADGLVLAAGKVLFGHPWFGLLCMVGFMCAAICWMLQAWLPPTWALLGGLLAVVRLGLFTYWINLYSGAGSIAALGGALVLGALPRFMKTVRLRYGILMAVGISLLAISRPYEGLLLCVPVSIVLGRWILVGKNKPTVSVLFQRTALPLALIVATGAWMGYYDYRAFGSPLTPPYKVNRTTYAVAPYYIWQSPRPEPVYHHEVMRNFYVRDEMHDYGQIKTLLGFSRQTLIKFVRGVFFFSGFALLPPLIMLRRVCLDRRTRFLLLCSLVLAAGMFIENFLYPHYIAAFTAAFYAIGLQAMRHLRVWRPGGQPVGATLTRLIVCLCFLLVIARLHAATSHPKIVMRSDAISDWGGPENYGVDRARIEDELEHEPGKQLAIVRYSPDHEAFNEWVYNAPDIDNSKVIWAREMDDANNLDLIRHYKDRKVWLVQPDLQPAGLFPYPSRTNAPPSMNSISTAKGEKKSQSGG